MDEYNGSVAKVITHLFHNGGTVCKRDMRVAFPVLALNIKPDRWHAYLNAVTCEKCKAVMQRKLGMGMQGGVDIQ